MTIKAVRRTPTGGTTYVGDNAVLSHGLGPDFTPASVDLSIRIAAGKGTAEVIICIQPKDFEQIAQAMMNVDPGAAIQAFGAAMVAGNRSTLHPLVRP